MTKARQILELHERLKPRVLSLPHSQFSVPLLDYVFQQPVFPASALDGQPHMPSRIGKVSKIEQILYSGYGRLRMVVLG
jgi:hypothetical protein